MKEARDGGTLRAGNPQVARTVQSYVNVCALKKQEYGNLPSVEDDLELRQVQGYVMDV